MLALLALIPGVGPILAGAIGIFGGVLKPVASAAAGIGSSALGLAKTALGNPAVVGAVCAAAFFLMLKLEEDGKATLKAQLLNPATGHAWSADYQREHPALLTAIQSLTVLTAATKRETDALTALEAAGKAKMAQASAVGQSYAATLALSAKHSAAIVAADKGATACDRAQAVDQAFLETLQ